MGSTSEGANDNGGKSGDPSALAASAEFGSSAAPLPPFSSDFRSGSLAAGTAGSNDVRTGGSASNSAGPILPSSAGLTNAPFNSKSPFAGTVPLGGSTPFAGMVPPLGTRGSFATRVPPAEARSSSGPPHLSPFGNVPGSTGGAFGVTTGASSGQFWEAAPAGSSPFTSVPRNVGALGS